MNNGAVLKKCKCKFNVKHRECLRNHPSLKLMIKCLTIPDRHFRNLEAKFHRTEKDGDWYIYLQCFAPENAKRAYKSTKKTCKSFKLDKSDAVNMGTTAVKPYLSLLHITREFYSIKLICTNLYAVFSHVRKAYTANQNCVQLFHM